MNISTGMHATREVQDSLLSAVNEGEKFLALDQLSSYVNGIYQHHDRGNICGYIYFVFFSTLFVFQDFISCSEK
jgi:hypothetical protein